MSDPLEPAVPFEDLPGGHLAYLLACATPADPTMVWGTEVAFEALLDAVGRANRAGEAVVTPVAFVVKAVERCLEEHPEMNVRILKGRVRPFRRRHVQVSVQRGGGEVGVIPLRELDGKGVTEIARALWEGLIQERDRPRPGFRFASLLARTGVGLRIVRAAVRYGIRSGLVRDRGVSRGAPVLVNFLGARELPSMRAFHPSRLPVDYVLTTVTVGRPEPRPAVVDGEVVVRTLAPVFVRSDHRITDGTSLGRFVGSLKEFLENPDELLEAGREPAR